jgi:hypothetical protein
VKLTSPTSASDSVLTGQRSSPHGKPLPVGGNGFRARKNYLIHVLTGRADRLNGTERLLVWAGPEGPDDHPGSPLAGAPAGRAATTGLGAGAGCVRGTTRRGGADRYRSAGRGWASIRGVKPWYDPRRTFRPCRLQPSEPGSCDPN